MAPVHGTLWIGGRRGASQSLSLACPPSLDPKPKPQIHAHVYVYYLDAHVPVRAHRKHEQQTNTSPLPFPSPPSQPLTGLSQTRSAILSLSH